MNARLGLILATAALFSASGCATGGGGPSSSAPADLPSLVAGQGESLAEGIRPRDNSHTNAAELYLSQGTAAVEGEKAGFFQQALDAAMEGIAADPENPKSYFQAAVANVHLKDYVAADSLFDKAEELHPRYVLETEPWREQGWVGAYNDAIIPLNAGDIEGAVAIFEGANAMYDKRPEALLQLGSGYARLGEPEKSADAYRKAMGLLEESREAAMADSVEGPTWVEHWEIATMGLGQSLHASEQYEEAADLYRRLLQEKPDDPAIIGSLASVFAELQMPDSADALFDNLLNRPGLTEFDYSNAGVGLYRIEEYDRAAQAFKAAADMNPLNRDARLNLAQTHYIAENWEEVIPAARDLLELDPLNGFVWIYLTRALSELERVEEANATFEEYQATGYQIDEIALTALSTGGAEISGMLKNNSAEAGETVTLRFHFGGQGGREIGTIDIRIQLPAVEELVEFSGEFTSSDPVTGYRYEVVG